MTVRQDRMLYSSPQYYWYSQVYNEIQAAQSTEYDTLEEANEDLRKQLYIVTATWGLKYWEKTLGITIKESDSYSIRRSRVLSKWRGVGNFSAAMIRNVAEAYSGGQVRVLYGSKKYSYDVYREEDLTEYTVFIRFTGVYGIPPNIDDLKEVLSNIVHAHLDVVYEYTYLYWDVMDQQALTWDELDAKALTWNEYEKGIWLN